MNLITNSNQRYRDRMFLKIQEEANNSEIWIATAFFSNYDLLKYMDDHGCNVTLIVRLNVGTNAIALEKALKLPHVRIRYYTERIFHPKYYIFSDRVAFIGSSNFTKSGMTTNQEMNIKIDGDSPDFEDLRSIFIEYWENAAVLTKEKVKEFSDFLKNNPPKDPSDGLAKVIGKVQYDTIGLGNKTTKADEFYLSFSRKYQDYIKNFNELKTIYQSTGDVKFLQLPLRIEVDRFLWWIREEKAQGESYKVPKAENFEAIKNSAVPLINEFKGTRIPYLEDDNVPKYLEVKELLSTPEGIDEMRMDDLFDALLHIHAFHDCMRFYNGGVPGMKQFFLENNDHQKIRDTIKYLLFGPGEYQQRVCDCIFDEKLKLKGFGESCVKELYGLINQEEIPVSNGRTKKSMEFLGFGQM